MLDKPTDLFATTFIRLNFTSDLKKFKIILVSANRVRKGQILRTIHPNQRVEFAKFSARAEVFSRLLPYTPRPDS